MPERTTRDLDGIIAVTDIAVARQRLAAAGYVALGDLSIGAGIWRAPTGIEVDVLECRAPWCPVALADASRNRDVQGLPVLPLPYLVLMKLQSGRAQDVADLARMLGQAAPSLLDNVRAAVRIHAPADIDDLESLIALGRLEMAEDASPGDFSRGAHVRAPLDGRYTLHKDRPVAYFTPGSYLGEVFTVG